MPKIIDYTVVLESWHKMQADVKLKITGGWQPIGGIAKTGDGMFAQAMVKYEDEDDRPGHDVLDSDYKQARLHPQTRRTR